MHIEAINPIFPCKDVKANAAYFREVLGFNGDFEWEEECKITYAIVDFEGQGLHLTYTDKATTPSLAYVFCSPIEEIYASFQAKGAKIRQELETYPWGMREFEVEDLEGNRLIFGENQSEE